MDSTAALRFVSESALLVEYGETLSDQIHHRVLALDAALRASDLAQSIEILPTFRSLLICFDPFKTSHDRLLNTLIELDTDHIDIPYRRWRVPVCFGTRYAQDLPEVANILDLTENQLIETLLAGVLKVYMYGFAPGFAYLGGLDARLAIPRRATPRAPMPPGSLMIAGGLASLSSVSLPTGWFVLGQTPITLFSADRQPMVPFGIGDQLQLVAVSETEFARLSRSSGLAGLEQR